MTIYLYICSLIVLAIDCHSYSGTASNWVGLAWVFPFVPAQSQLKSMISESKIRLRIKSTLIKEKVMTLAILYNPWVTQLFYSKHRRRWFFFPYLTHLSLSVLSCTWSLYVTVDGVISQTAEWLNRCFPNGLSGAWWQKWPLFGPWPLLSHLSKGRCEKPFRFKQYLFAHYSLMETKGFFSLMDSTDMQQILNHHFIQPSWTSNVAKTLAFWQTAPRFRYLPSSVIWVGHQFKNINELVDFQKIDDIYIEEVKPPAQYYLTRNLSRLWE